MRGFAKILSADLYEQRVLRGNMNTLDLILDNGIIAIARGIYGENLKNAAKALFDAGIRAFEVTFEQDGDSERTLEAIAMLNREFSYCCAVGAGTVLTEHQLSSAKKAGASYIVSPNTDEAVIKRTKELGMVSIPGAMTPTEIITAHMLGADIVKLFPAGELGLAYFKAVRAPLSNIRLAAVAGITHDNIGEFKKAGACAFGISSGLFVRELIAQGRYEALRDNASRYLSLIR